LCLQSATLCGWLLPGPNSVVPAGAPLPFAICAAVPPLPWRFEASEWAAVCTVAAPDPADAQVALDPLPPPVEQEVLWCPARSSSSDAPLSFPWPFPASAEPVVFGCSGPQLSAETALEGRDDAVSELRCLLVGEGLLARLEGDGEGDRLLVRSDLVAAVDVEGAHLA
jgi:hypothetical protein